MRIRKAVIDDLSRIAEIYVFNNRINFFPIFKDESFSFGELQVVSLIDSYFKKDEIINNIYVSDDGLIKGFVQMDGTEIRKLYVDTSFQSEGIGNELIEFAIKELHANNLWALEKNVRAISFYQKHGFHLTGQKKFEEDTTEYLVKGYRPKCVSVLACVPLWRWAFLLFELYGWGTRGRPECVSGMAGQALRHNG